MYYYNARTRESAWTKPENVKIITQSEVEAMAAAQGGATTSSGPTTAAQAAVAQGNSSTFHNFIFVFSKDNILTLK